MSFKENLEAALKDINISSFSRKIGISDETIRYMLAGKSENPRLDTVIKIAQGLDISLDELVFNKDTDGQANFPYDKKLWKECMEFIEDYIETNGLTGSIKLKQLFCTIDAVFEHSISNSLKTIDKKFALWFCQKNLK